MHKKDDHGRCLDIIVVVEWIFRLNGSISWKADTVRQWAVRNIRLFSPKRMASQVKNEGSRGLMVKNLGL